MLHLALVRKLKLVGLILVGVGISVGMILFIIGFFKPKIAGVYIDSNPSSNIYIDGEQVGRTPYRNKRTPGEIVLRLIPESFENPLAPYDTKITLVQGVETVIKRDFGQLQDTSSGEIISFEKIDRSQTSLVIISIPDSAQVVIDGKDRAFTPHKTNFISPGEHKLTLTMDGYLEKNVEVKTHLGYKLTAIVQLAKAEPSSLTTPTPPPTGTEETKIQIEILSTPTGYLRVRKEPSTLADEVGKVEPGEKYNLLGEDEKSGWYKIEYEEGKEGWITNQYAKKVSAGTLSTTPTPSVKKPSPTPAKIVTPTPLN